jgi:hypothetical protein
MAIQAKKHTPCCITEYVAYLLCFKCDMCIASEVWPVKFKFNVLVLMITNW